MSYQENIARIQAQQLAQQQQMIRKQNQINEQHQKMIQQHQNKMNLHHQNMMNMHTNFNTGVNNGNNGSSSHAFTSMQWTSVDASDPKNNVYAKISVNPGWGNPI